LTLAERGQAEDHQELARGRRSRAGLRGVFVGVVVAELVAIAALGVWTARNEYVSYGDEMVHFSYTQFLADTGHLPVLGRDLATRDALVLGREVTSFGMINCPQEDPAWRFDANWGKTLCGSYEAFQPPLWYLLTVPVYKLGRAESLGGSPHRAFMALRYLGVLFLLVSAGLAMLLVREVLPGPRALPVSTFVLSVFLLPGTVVRFVTVANSILELPLALGLTILLWRAWTRDSARTLVAASAVFGLCVLTKVTLAPLVVPLGVTAALLLWRRRGAWRRAVVLGGVTAVVPLLLVAPWLSFNRSHFDAWTANDLARTVQAVVINPHNRAYGYDEIADGARDAIERITVPQEWRGAPDVAGGAPLRWALLAILVGVPLVIAIRRIGGWRRRAPDDVLDPRALVLLALPILLAIGLLAFETRTERWPVMLSRYFLFAFPGLVVFGALQWQALLGGGRRLLVLSGSTVGLTLALWLVVAPHIP
jgi:4-amino-4-deoxy-L-arabinose transferase-like glycosyltransferase